MRQEFATKTRPVLKHSFAMSDKHRGLNLRRFRENSPAEAYVITQTLYVQLFEVVYRPTNCGRRFSLKAFTASW